MRLMVLTTETLHHAYFVRELNKVTPIDSTVIETTCLQPPFETAHPFEEIREVYERDHWFQGHPPRISEFSQTWETPSVNQFETIEYIRQKQPDVLVVFGTGKISTPLIQTCPEGIINLHGGDPEYYRGLDSHLWAIYHRDFDGLITTLHHLNEELDDGHIILQAPIPLQTGMQIQHLRRYNTEVCVKLTASALDMYRRYGHFIARPQRQKGRYYSFMPSVLKEICRKRLAGYTRNL